MNIIISNLFHLDSVIYILFYHLLILRVCNKITSPDTTGMIRSCSNRYGKSGYEFFDGYIIRSRYQPTKTHITCTLVPSEILYSNYYCVQHTFTWNPLIPIIPSYNGYKMENKYGIAHDISVQKILPTMTTRSLHDDHDFYYRMHLPLPICILIIHCMELIFRITLVLY